MSASAWITDARTQLAQGDHPAAPGPTAGGARVTLASPSEQAAYHADDQTRLRRAGEGDRGWADQTEIGVALSLGCTALTEGRIVTASGICQGLCAGHCAVSRWPSVALATNGSEAKGWSGHDKCDRDMGQAGVAGTAVEAARQIWFQDAGCCHDMPQDGMARVWLWLCRFGCGPGPASGRWPWLGVWASVHERERSISSVPVGPRRGP